jgi:hypothetical protein
MVKQQQMQAAQQDQQILSESTDPDEIMNAKLRIREAMGYGQGDVPDEQVPQEGGQNAI